MKYKGYRAAIEYDPQLNTFYGLVLDLEDVLTFQGNSVAELQAAMVETIDEYLDYCARSGRVPDKSYSGRFVVRVAPELHRNLVQAARQADVSLNQLVSEACEAFLARGTAVDVLANRLQTLRQPVRLDLHARRATPIPVPDWLARATGAQEDAVEARLRVTAAVDRAVEEILGEVTLREHPADYEAADPGAEDA